MARELRTRAYSAHECPSGQLVGVLNGVPFNFPNLPAGHGFGLATCSDSHGRPTVDSDLRIDHQDPSNLGFVNGQYEESNAVPGYREATASNMLPEFLRNSPATHISLPLPPAGDAMTTLLARTNPSRPQVVPLSIVQDIADLPKMLKEAGDFLKRRGRKIPITARDVANQHLAFKFGWLPLINDIHELLNVNQYVDRRVGEIKRLYTAPGLKRRIKLGRVSDTDSDQVVVNSDSLCFIVARRSRTTTANRWGTVRWRIVPEASPSWYRPEHAFIFQEARRLVTGFSVEGLFEGAWDLLPWSFLIDWGTNASEYIASQGSSIPALPSNASVMTATTTIERWSVVSMPKGYTYEPGSRVATTKERYCGSATISAHIPFLDMSRLSVLGSLFVQRMKR